MTTFNRKETTLRCLRSLAATNAEKLVQMRIFIVDASSSDGTREAVAEEFPDVDISSASSDTYWATGMRQAWERAQVTQYDALLWLNDDVILDADAIAKIKGAVQEFEHQSIIVGAFRDPETSEPTYGGFKFGPVLRRLSMAAVKPNGSLTAIDAANGNLIWVPNEIDKKLGGFPKGYSHGMADHAFTFEARRKGISVLLTAETVGTCGRNAITGTWQDTSLTVGRRLELLKSPKGLPFTEWWRFCVRYGGLSGPLYAVKPYLTVYLHNVKDTLSKRTTHRHD